MGRVTSQMRLLPFILLRQDRIMDQLHTVISLVHNIGVELVAPRSAAEQRPQFLEGGAAGQVVPQGTKLNVAQVCEHE